MNKPKNVLPPRGISTAQEAKAARIMGWSEKELQEHVLLVARTMGYLAYHTHDSRRSTPGFPDLVLVHARKRRVLWRELKTSRGRVSPEQMTWIEALRQAGMDAGVWRPADVVDGTVESALSLDLSKRGEARA